MTTFSRADRQILDILQKDGRLSNVELAERIGMSPSPCLRRVKRLEEMGVISRYVAVLDRSKIGLGIIAHVELKVPQVANASIIDRFREAVQKEPAVIGCYMTTGRFDFLLTVVARDMDEFSQLAMKKLLKLPGVQDMHSSFVLGVFKDSMTLPVPHD
jgi:Lrp/AsnC family transcriptional regulator, leucine-responsive regulatory protein